MSKTYQQVHKINQSRLLDAHQLSALINIVTLYTVMYIQNYNKNLNIAESTSLQNVNLAEFILAFLEGPLKYAKISTPRK
jgi:hypothetical protein